MRPLWIGTAFLVACSGGSATPGTHPQTQTPGEFAGENQFVPSYQAAELSRALQKERGAEAIATRVLADLEAKDTGDDQLRITAADLAVRRRFIQSLERCEVSRRECPPRLDEPSWAFDPDPDKPSAPPVTANLRFDLDSWRTLASELHGRACACRTIACVDSVGVAIDQLEVRPMEPVQGDETASLSITRARECLFRLRGKRPARALESP